MNLDERVIAAVGCHPKVRSIRLVGSRAQGTSHDRSDWDFVVYTELHAFAAVADALPALLAPFEPLAYQWDRLSRHACWMVMLRGPTKIDLIFPDETHATEPPWKPSSENLAAMDVHFWDWILWLHSKQARSTELVAAQLVALFEHLLQPLGVERSPTTIEMAVHAYRSARDLAEVRFGVQVMRELAHEVAPALGA